MKDLNYRVLNYMAGWDTLLNHLILLKPTYFSFYISICSYKACITLQIQELLELLVRLMDCAVSCEKIQKVRESVSLEPRRCKHLVTQTLSLLASNLLDFF